MKTFNVTFEHGHFIDNATGKRIIPVQGRSYVIASEDGNFRESDLVTRPIEVLSPSEKHAQFVQKYGAERIVNILPAGTRLFFRIGNSFRVQGDETFAFIFLCELLEDLYLYKIETRSAADRLAWRLTNCACQLVSCLQGDLAISEQLQAESLNALFRKVVNYFFVHQRSDSVNALDSFYLYQPGMQIIMEQARDGSYHGLHEIRKAVTDRFAKEMRKSARQN